MRFDLEFIPARLRGYKSPTVKKREKRGKETSENNRKSYLTTCSLSPACSALTSINFVASSGFMLSTDIESMDGLVA